MVFTVEPGLYINSQADVHSRWRGIGIRIEDNVIIRRQGHEVITSDVPTDPAEIEAIMA